MRRGGSLLVSWVSIVVLVAGPAPATPVDVLPDVHQVRGRTTFTTTETATARIRFPHSTDFIKDLRLRIEGAGRIYGFLMRKVGEYEQEGYRPVIDAVTVGACSRPGCEGVRHPFFFIVGFNVDDLAGVWDLYAVADGAPVAVTFLIEGEEANAVIPVTNRVESEIKTLRPTVHETNTDTIYSAGGFSKLDHVGRGMVGLWTIGEPHAGTAFGECLYYGKDGPDEETAFLPGCPTADGDPWVAPATGTRGGVIFSSAAWGPTRGVGGWYTTAADVKRYGAVAFWIDF